MGRRILACCMVYGSLQWNMSMSTHGLTGRLLQRKQLEGIVCSNVKILILQADYFIYLMFMQQKLLCLTLSIFIADQCLTGHH